MENSTTVVKVNEKRYNIPVYVSIPVFDADDFPTEEEERIKVLGLVWDEINIGDYILGMRINAREFMFLRDGNKMSLDSVVYYVEND